MNTKPMIFMYSIADYSVWREYKYGAWAISKRGDPKPTQGAYNNLHALLKLKNLDERDLRRAIQ